MNPTITFSEALSTDGGSEPLIMLPDGVAGFGTGGGLMLGTENSMVDAGGAWSCAGGVSAVLRLDGNPATLAAGSGYVT